MPIIIGCLFPVTIGIYTDYTRNKIYDAITLPILLSGFVYASTQGSITEALIGSGAIFTVYFILALLVGGVGGGDIKLAAGIGAWFGLWGGIYIMGIASILALITSLCKFTFLGILKKKLMYWYNGIYLFLLYKEMTIRPAQLPKEGEEMPVEAVPFGIHMGLAVWAWYLYTYQPWKILVN